MKLYRLCREHVRDEDALINHRAQWLVGSQSFLIAAYVLLFTNQDRVPEEQEERSQMLFVLIPALGITLSVISLFGICAALWALRDILVWYDERVPQDQVGEDVPRLISTRSRRLLGCGSSLALGPAIAGFWSIQLFVHDFNLWALAFILGIWILVFVMITLAWSTRMPSRYN